MDTLDIPQANTLAKVRHVVSAATWLSAEPPVDLTGIAGRTAASRRHTWYRLHTARVLGLLRLEGDAGVVVADLGHRLLDTAAGSADERAVLARAVEQSSAVQAIAPDLLGPSPPSAAPLADRIEALASLKASTALRRAKCLLSWRWQILDEVVPDAAQPEASTGTAEVDLPFGQLSLL